WPCRTPIAATASSIPACSRATIATSAPASTKVLATARPMPLLPPVTSAFLPVSLMSIPRPHIWRQHIMAMLTPDGTGATLNVCAAARLEVNGARAPRRGQSLRARLMGAISPSNGIDGLEGDDLRSITPQRFQVAEDRLV